LFVFSKGEVLMSTEVSPLTTAVHAPNTLATRSLLLALGAVAGEALLFISIPTLINIFPSYTLLVVACFASVAALAVVSAAQGTRGLRIGKGGIDEHQRLVPPQGRANQARVALILSYGVLIITTGLFFITGAVEYYRVLGQH
jgi:hypothetical protein